ncbi:DUF3253 domain-containing protein [Aurantiacibacter spongiae]|uniref:DUF3253 domain-containing protein n=1 Tax=Aurantiacibacter spongiae TaxID=2488860 RepID=A0A3N5CV35_9SPHN|nr:DUF3253 domain-containing protein [Aurantiacibacter spongiae]RPF72206.1 DUF3253 domain-containing protein [Aurantiacibacter spongiae]
MTPDQAILRLLEERGEGKTICPSEAARLLTEEGSDWRERMGDVHAAAGRLGEHGRIRTTWRGEPRAVGDGPYRIARADARG